MSCCAPSRSKRKTLRPRILVLERFFVRDRLKFIVPKPPRDILSAAAMTMMPAHAAPARMSAQPGPITWNGTEGNGIRNALAATAGGLHDGSNPRDHPAGPGRPH